MSSSKVTCRLVEPLDDYVRKMLATGSTSERLQQLEQTAQFIVERLRSGREASLIFICTHNSRRSHFGHIWADTAAKYYGLDAVRCYSGGVETTACSERTVRALRRAGFSVGVATDAGQNVDSSNPAYWVQNVDDLTPPVTLFSKIYSVGNAGVKDFAAMMCCSDVDTKCPVVADAVVRIPLHYDDPKEADDTPQEAARYDERCLQIGADMFGLMKLVIDRV